MRKYVLATMNPHKVIEIQRVLSNVELLERPSDIPEVAETGSTLEENARLKAVAVVESTGIGAIADDTGLWVDALDGEPGINAAYYAGRNVTFEDNQNKMLAALAGVPPELRTAHFKTIALLRNPDGSELIAEGVVEGVITTEAAGNGWGYDPIFVPNESDGRRFSEMTEAEKNAISHRGRAFAKLVELIGSSKA